MSISKITVGNTTHEIVAGGTIYAVCETAATTVAKTATVHAGIFSLITGARVSVKFTEANSAASPTLNVASTGAKAIYWNGTALASSQYWQAGAVLDFIYNGYQWDLIGIAKDNNTTYPTANGTTAGITVVYPAASCTTFSSDTGTVTPLAVQKGAKMFAITRPSSTTVNAVTRYSNTTGDVKDSKITIEDVTNTRDTSKTANVLAIPAEGGKKMVYGYCTDQIDGTSFIGGVFSADATEYPYAQGLAIGGTSGNLLWKGNKVIDAGCIGDYANKYVHPSYTARTGKPTANQTPAFGGTVTVSQITSDGTGHVTGATDRTITIPSTLSNGTGTAGLIKTSSTVTSNSGYTACPVINGVPYYKDTNTTYTHPSYTAKSSGLYKVTVDASGHVSATTAVTKADITALGIPASDTNTTYSAGTGISLSGTTFSNSGVRSIATGSTNGTISVNTNGTSAEVFVAGLGTAAFSSSANFATKAQGTKADNAMPKAGGTFTGNVYGNSTNTDQSCFRNISVRNSAGNSLISTNYLIMLRK